MASEAPLWNPRTLGNTGEITFVCKGVPLKDIQCRIYIHIYLLKKHSRGRTECEAGTRGKWHRNYSAFYLWVSHRARLQAIIGKKKHIGFAVVYIQLQIPGGSLTMTFGRLVDHAKLYFLIL